MALGLEFECAHDGLEVSVGRALLVVGAQTRVDAAEMEVAVHRRQGLVRAPLREHGADVRQLLLDALPQAGKGRIVQAVPASLLVGLQDCVDPAESQLVELLVGQPMDGAQLAPLPAVFQPLARRRRLATVSSLVRRLRMTSRLPGANASCRSVGRRRRR